MGSVPLHTQTVNNLKEILVHVLLEIFVHTSTPYPVSTTRMGVWYDCWTSFPSFLLNHRLPRTHPMYRTLNRFPQVTTTHHWSVYPQEGANR